MKYEEAVKKLEDIVHKMENEDRPAINQIM